MKFHRKCLEAVDLLCAWAIVALLRLQAALARCQYSLLKIQNRTLKRDLALLAKMNGRMT